MAIFIPSLDEIKKWREEETPTDGEWFLLNFLTYLDDSYEIYFKPYMNEDRPDVLIMRKDHGVLIIEVKDWDLSNYQISKVQSSDNTKNDSTFELHYTPTNWIKLSSPVVQVKKYYENLMNFHVKGLLPQLLLNSKKYAIVTTMVFFYGTDRSTLFESAEFKEYTQKYDVDHSNKNYDTCIFSSEDLTKEKFNKLLYRNYINRQNKSYIFTEQIYQFFKQQLNPTNHNKNQGKHIEYTPKQMEIIYDVKAHNNKKGLIYSPKESPTLNAYIRGTYGSGKTTVLAATAVATYSKLKEKYTKPKILILCYNLTLVNWLKDRLCAVQENFSFKDFIICNYHNFINSFLTQMNVKIVYPDDNFSKEEKERYWEENYYG
ncbi:MAG: NERD domain-containing protein, partial [Succinivibrio sp.]